MTRQYTTFMALMNNYDFYEENLKRAKNAEGSLEEQANIYAESWEAARERVQAALEDIYTKIIRDDFFIDLSNGFAKALDGIGGFIDGLGGVKGMLLLISSIFTRTFANKMPQVLTSLKENLLIAFGQGPRLMQKMQQENQENLKAFQADPRTTSAEITQATGLIKISEMQEKYAVTSKMMSESDKIQYQQRIKNIQSIYEEIAALQKAHKTLKERTSRIIDRRTESNYTEGVEYQRNQYDEQLRSARERRAEAERKYAEANQAYNEMEQEYNNWRDLKKGKSKNKLNDYENKLKELEKARKSAQEERDMAAIEERDFPSFEQEDQLSREQMRSLKRDYVKQNTIWATADYEGRNIFTDVSNWGKNLTTSNVEKTREIALAQAEAIKKSLKKVEEETGKSFNTKALDAYIEKLKSCKENIEEVAAALDLESNEEGSAGAVLNEFQMVEDDSALEIERIADTLRGQGFSRENMSELIRLAEDQADAFVEQLQAEERAITIPIDFKPSPLQFSQVIMEISSAFMGLQSIIYSTQSALSVFDDETSSIADKVGAFTGAFSSWAFGITGVIKAFNALKASSLSANVAQKLVEKGMSQAKATALGFTAALSALTIVVLALVAAYKIWKWWSSQKSEEEKNAERAAENLKQQEENLERVKSRYEEIKNVLEGYSSVQNTLKNLATGTEEWKEQVEELNKQIVDLVTKYPELNNFIHLNEKGILEIDSDKLEEAEKEKLIKQQEQSTAAKIDDTWAKFDLRVYHLADLMGRAVKNDYSEKRREQIAQEKYEKRYQDLDDNTQEDIDNIVRTEQEKYDKVDNQTNKAVIYDLAEQYHKQGESLLVEQAALINEIALASSSTIDNVQDTIRAYEQNRKYEYTALESALSSANQDNEFYQNSKYKDLILEAQAENVRQMRQNREGLISDDIDRKTIRGWLDNKQSDITGYGNLKYGEGSNASIKKESLGNITIEYTNVETGEREEKKLDKDIMAEEWETLWGNEAAFDRAINDFDYEGILKKFANQEKIIREIGFISQDSAEQMIRSLNQDETINLAQLSESEVKRLSEVSDSLSKKYSELDSEVAEDVSSLVDSISNADYEKYWQEGGQLGANNSEYAEAYKTIMAIKKEEDSINQRMRLFGEDETTAIEKVLKIDKEAAEKSAVIIHNVQSIYNTLDEENKKYFASMLDLTEDISIDAIREQWEANKEARAKEKLKAAADQYGLDQQVLKRQAQEFKKTLEATSDELSDSANAAADMAIANQRLNKGVKTLTDDWKDWKKALKETDKTTQDWAEAALGVEEAIRDILRLGADDIIPEDFLKNSENIDLLDQIANGSEEAVEKLHFNLTKAQIDSEELTVAIRDNLLAVYDDLSVDEVNSKFEELKTSAISALNQIREAAQDVNIGSELGSPEKQKEWAEALNEYAMATKMTTDQMNSFLSSVGVQATVDTVQGDIISKKVPITKTTEHVDVGPAVDIPDVIGPNGTMDDMGSYYTRTITSDTQITGYKTVTEPTLIPQISFGDEPLKPIFKKSGFGTISPSSTSSSKGSSGGKGGGSSKTPQKKAPVKPKKKEDEIERYYEINKAIGDQEKTVSRLEKQESLLYGNNRLNAMDKKIKANQALVDLEKEKIKEAKNYLALDKQYLESQGAAFDENGRINNYDEIMNEKMTKWLLEAQAAEDKLTAYEERKNNDENYDADGSEKLRLEEERTSIDENYENFKEGISKYNESLDTIIDGQDKVIDLLQERLTQNLEKLEYKLEIRIELNEDDLKNLEHQLSRLSENDYTKSAERIALIEKNARTIRLSAEDTKKAIQELEEKHNAYLAGDIENGISTSDYLAKLKELKDQTLDYETQLREGISKIGEELQNTFNLMFEQLDLTYEKIERRLNFADFYKDISKVINGETNYDILNAMIDKEVELTNVRIKGRLQERAILENEQAKFYTQLNDPAISNEAKEQIKKTLTEVESRIADLNSEVQSDIQALADYAQKEFENSIEKIANTWQEQNFGESLSAVLEDIDLRNRAQEELLTKTNQVYETNKLIRQAEKDIAATTNKRAKQAYEEYINKAKQKQEQKELTQLELDLLTAKYEITKAQIALEEAKDAKDTVRLTRDSEGNFGYVYTANQDKISDAQQALDDATNNYYNTALEGAKSSSEQIYQLQQKWLEEVNAINLNAQLGEEQKQAKIAEITEYYETMMTQQREKYYIAKGAIEESSYEHELDYNLKSIDDAEKWFETKDDVIDNMGQAEEVYQKRIENVSNKVEDAYGDQEEALDYVARATEQYGKDLDNLIPIIEGDLIDAVGNATLAWQEYANQLCEVIRLSNEAMGLDSDAQLKEAYGNDYAQRIKDLLAAGYSEDDPVIQKLLKLRLEKLGGVDDTDYQALINSATNDLDKQLYTVLRNYKKDNNNWMQSIQNDILAGKSLEEYQWKYVFRDDKLEKMYGTSNARTTAQDVEKWLNDTDWMEKITTSITEGASEVVVGIISEIRDDKQIRLGLDPTTEKDLQKWLVEDSEDFVATSQQILKDNNYNWNACLEILTNLSKWQDKKLGEEAGTTLNELYDWYEANRPKIETPSPSNSSNNNDWVLGTVSKKYEVGENGNGGTISSGKGDNGGTSYGLPQFSTNTGSAKAFANWLAENYPEMGSALKGLKPGTSAFNNAWKETYNKYGIEFEQIQMDYAWNEFALPWVEKAQKKTGIDFTRSRALKELAYSTAVQYGSGGTYVLPSSLNSAMTDEEIVTAIQNYKLANVDSNFKNSSAKVRAGVRNRIPQELKSLLQLIAEDASYNTGGYTGDWGPEGKMAILHEKELVLNADDTKNILTSVGIIREISKALDNSALWSALGMANLNASYIAAGGSDTLQQEVTIHADFPNVQDHNEIEMAIDNLINAASQYAYRN